MYKFLFTLSILNLKRNSAKKTQIDFLLLRNEEQFYKMSKNSTYFKMKIGKDESIFG